MRKYFVLTILFVLPLVVYLFFASGINHFAKLPVLTKNIKDISDISTESLKDKITVLGFFGKNIEERYGDAGNLNQEIYKRFNEFKDFQFLMIQPKGTQNLFKELLQEMNRLTETNFQNWKFVSLSDEDLISVFNSLETDINLDSNLGTSYVFIVDRNGNLRGRDDKEGVKFGYDSRFVADINNNMVDDVKVILAEYRMALKKNNIYKDEL
jgi:glutathione peroxidase-family protein